MLSSRSASAPHPRLAIAFGAAVRRLREQAGYSQLAFALKARISRTYAGEIERGEKSPTLDVVERIAVTLGLTYTELFAHVDAEMGTRKPPRPRPRAG